MNKVFTTSKVHCLDHRPEIALLRRPAVKVCSSCGQVEKLEPSDFAWRTTRSRVFANAIKRFAPCALAAGSALFAAGTLVYEWIPARTSADTAYPSDSEVVKRGAAPRSSTGAENFDRLPVLTPSTIAGDKAIVGLPNKEVWQPQSPAALPATSASLPRTPIVAHITKAIGDRAISGIQIEYDRGTAQLSGRVQTQSQRIAAETAAKSVAGVNRVVSSIQVDWQE